MMPVTYSVMKIAVAVTVAVTARAETDSRLAVLVPAATIRG
jgi:hypothetical protein